MKEATVKTLRPGGLTKSEFTKYYKGHIQYHQNLTDVRKMLRWLEDITGISYSRSWSNMGFDYIATIKDDNGIIIEAYGFFWDEERTVNLIPMYTFCPACNNREKHKESRGLWTCNRCEGEFGFILTKDQIPYDLLKPSCEASKDPKDWTYFDLTLTTYGKVIERWHGYYDKATGAVAQWG